MEDLIKEIKEKNGNIAITQKDMVWYLVAKVDKIYDKLDNKVDKKTFYWMFGIFTTLLIALTIGIN